MIGCALFKTSLPKTVFNKLYKTIFGIVLFFSKAKICQFLMLQFAWYTLYFGAPLWPVLALFVEWLFCPEFNPTLERMIIQKSNNQLPSIPSKFKTNSTTPLWKRPFKRRIVILLWAWSRERELFSQLFYPLCQNRMKLKCHSHHFSMKRLFLSNSHRWEIKKERNKREILNGL